MPKAAARGSDGRPARIMDVRFELNAPDLVDCMAEYFVDLHVPHSGPIPDAATVPRPSRRAAEMWLRERLTNYGYAQDVRGDLRSSVKIAEASFDWARQAAPLIWPDIFHKADPEALATAGQDIAFFPGAEGLPATEGTEAETT